MVGIDAAPAGAGVLWKNVPAGVVLPFRARRILADGTTATNILALYNGPAILPSASIISPAVLSQPGATQRYQRAMADRPGTWSICSGGDAASFTLDSATGIHTINQAAAGDGTTTLTKTLPLIFTPTDGTAPATQTVILTLTTIASPTAASSSVTTDFSGTAGAALETLPGWTISRAAGGDINTPVLDGTGKIVGRYAYDGGNEGTWGILYTPSGTVAGSKTTFTIPKGDTTYSTINMFAVAAGYTDGVGVTMTPRSGQAESNASFIRQAGVKTDGTALGYMDWPAGNTIDVVFDVSADGNTLNVTWNGAASFTKTFDMTGKTKGTGFGFSGSGPYGPALDSGVVVNAVNYLKAVSGLVVTGAPLFSATNAATFSFTWSGNKPTRLQHRLHDATTGIAATPWMTGDSTIIGMTSGTISHVVTAPGAGSYIVRFRPLNDTPVVAASATQFLADVEPPQMMYNLRSTNYYQPAPPLQNNWGVYCEVRTDTSPEQLLMPYDGIGSAEPQDIQSTPGTIWASNDPTVTILSSNSTAGTLSIRVTDGTGQIGRRLEFTGINPTRFDVTQAGRTGVISPTWVAALEGTGGRDLDLSLGNSPTIEGNGFVRNTSADKFLRNDYGVGPDEPYQNIIAGIAAKASATPTFDKYWAVFGTDLTDQQVTDRFVYMRENLPVRVRKIVERGNEEWNDQFKSSLRTRLQGVREGWYGRATFGNPQPTLTVAFAGEGTTGNTASPLTPSGGLVFFNYYDNVGGSTGYVIWRAKQAVPAGTEIAVNSYWEVAVDIDALVAGKRFRSIRHNEIIEIARTVFGEARFQAEIVPVVMGQQGGIFDQFAIERTFVPGYWAKVKGAGTGFYLYQVGSIDPATVTAAQFEAAYRAGLPTLTTSVRQVVIDCLHMGKVPYFYEGFPHPNFQAYSDRTVPNYKTQHDILFASDAGKAIMGDIAYLMKSNVPGVVCGYDLFGTVLWSLKMTASDLNNKRRLGWLEGLSR